jgi:signal transduction histidine kinase
VENTPDETFPQNEDYTGGQPLSESERKLHSLLELGQIIGLDLEINEMIVQIAQKATEMMNADRFSLFLYDKTTDELYTTVALGMGRKEIRIHSSEGIAGYCFQSGETLNIPDVYKDPHFLNTVDRSTGYRTKSVLCMPFLGRSGQKLGVVELINKRDGRGFTHEDEAFLMMFNNHAAVFIEMAQLQEERIDALKKSQDELERLSRAKSKALDHLSHELRTPLALMQGTMRLLKGRFARHYPEVKAEGFFEILEKNLSRLLDIQQETDKIVRTSHDAESRLIIDEFEHLWRNIEAASEVTDEVKGMFQSIRDWIVRFVPSSSATLKVISLYEFADERLKEAKERTLHRKLSFYLEGDRKLSVIMEPSILKDVVSGLIKNAIENTPDEGAIYIKIELGEKNILLKVQDSGIGITDENRAQVFNGLFHTQETDLYGSRKPYDFNAGGKGLDLLLAKVYGQRFGFDVLLDSRRCVHIPKDKDTCPGQISQCPHCRNTLDCLSAGGSTFAVVMPVATTIKPSSIERNG